MSKALHSITLASLIALAGCSAGGGQQHETCKDQASTTDYGVKWQDDLRLAREAGKFTVDQVVDIQGKSFQNFSLLKDENWSAWCNYLDTARADAGF